MTSAEHYLRAEKLTTDAQSMYPGSQEQKAMLERARLHVSLAQVRVLAATMVGDMPDSESAGWAELFGVEQS